LVAENLKYLMIRKRLKGEIEFELFQQVPLPRSEAEGEKQMRPAMKVNSMDESVVVKIAV
jgi:hypothetical protein